VHKSTRRSEKNKSKRMTLVVTEVLESRVLLSGAYNLATPLVDSLATTPTVSAATISPAGNTTAIAAPVAVSPGNVTSPGPVLTTLTPTLTWDAIASTGNNTASGITGYEIILSDSTLSKSYTYTVGTSVTSYTIASGVLTAGDSFVWNVRGMNGNVSGAPSAYMYFQAPAAAVLPTPTAISPGNATSPGPVLTTLTPTFSWSLNTVGANPVNTFTGFQINIADTTANKSYTYTTGASVTSYTIASGVLTAGDKFAWTVRAMNGNVSGSPSAYMYFQAPAAAVLPTPTAISPGNATSPGPVLTTLTPTLTWSLPSGTSTSGITGYEIILGDSTASKSYTYTTGVSVTSYTIASGVLTAGDSFVWNVRAMNGNVSGSPSAYMYFQAPAAAVLPTPTAISPGNATSPGPVLTTLTPTLTWGLPSGTSTSGITGYEIILGDSTASKSYTYTVGASVTSYTIASGVLTAGDSFVWNVRAMNGNVSGSPSAYMYFQTPAAAVLPTPTAVSPGNATSPGPVLTTLTPTFTWSLPSSGSNTTSGITGYQINIADTTASKSYSYTTGASVTSYTIAAGVLTAGDKFAWTVRAVNGNVSGPASSYMYFQAPTAAVLPTPTAISPGNATSPGPVLTTLTPTFTWSLPSGTSTSAITGYEIVIGDSTASKSYTYTVGASVTSYTIATGVLTAGDSFVWNVRAMNGNVSGPASSYMYFQTPAAAVLPTPTAISPGNTTSPGPVLTTLTPTLTWSVAEPVGATGTFTGFQINIADTTASKSYSYTVGASVTSYTLAAGVLTAGDSFVWNVRAMNGNVSGSPSTYLYFQTPPAAVSQAPTALTPGNATSPGPVISTTLPPTFTWTAISGVTGYQISIADSTAAKTYTYTVGASVTSYTIASGVLTAGDSFVWNVRGLNGNVSGPASNYLYFQTPTATVLPTPVAVSPGNATAPGPVLTTLTPTFSWTPVTAGVTNSTITGYQINIADTTAGKSYSYTVGASVSSYTIASGILTAGDKFVWNVRALNGNTSGLPGNYLYFQTPAAVVIPTPIVTGPGSTTSPGTQLTTLTPTLSWNPISSGITGFQVNLYNVTAANAGGSSTSNKLSYQVAASASSYTLPSGVLIAGDTYLWNVVALNGSQSGSPSTYLFFIA